MESKSQKRKVDASNDNVLISVDNGSVSKSVDDLSSEPKAKKNSIHNIEEYLSTLKVQELKDELKNRGCKNTTGRKKELLFR